MKTEKYFTKLNNYYTLDYFILYSQRWDYFYNKYLQWIKRNILFSLIFTLELYVIHSFLPNIFSNFIFFKILISSLKNINWELLGIQRYTGRMRKYLALESKKVVLESKYYIYQFLGILFLFSVSFFHWFRSGFYLNVFSLYLFLGAIDFSFSLWSQSKSSQHKTLFKLIRNPLSFTLPKLIHVLVSFLLFSSVGPWSLIYGYAAEIVSKNIIFLYDYNKSIFKNKLSIEKKEMFSQIKGGAFLFRIFISISLSSLLMSFFIYISTRYFALTGLKLSLLLVPLVLNNIWFQSTRFELERLSTHRIYKTLSRNFLLKDTIFSFIFSLTLLFIMMALIYYALNIQLEFYQLIVIISSFAFMVFANYLNSLHLIKFISNYLRKNSGSIFDFYSFFEINKSNKVLLLFLDPKIRTYSKKKWLSDIEIVLSQNNMTGTLVKGKYLLIANYLTKENVIFALKRLSAASIKQHKEFLTLDDSLSFFDEKLNLTLAPDFDISKKIKEICLTVKDPFPKNQRWLNSNSSLLLFGATNIKIAIDL